MAAISAAAGSMYSKPYFAALALSRVQTPILMPSADLKAVMKGDTASDARSVRLVIMNLEASAMGIDIRQHKRLRTSTTLSYRSACCWRADLLFCHPCRKADPSSKVGVLDDSDRKFRVFLPYPLR